MGGEVVRQGSKGVLPLASLQTVLTPPMTVFFVDCINKAL